VSFQWEIPQLFERKVVVVTATIAIACQISGFIVSSRFHDNKRGEDLVFFGSMIFHAVTALAIAFVYEDVIFDCELSLARTWVFRFLGAVFILTALSPIPIKLWANGDWFFLVSQ
jgi:hypothetical protein